MTDQISKEMSMVEVQKLTVTLHAELMTAKNTEELDLYKAGIISTLEGLITCVRVISSEMVRIEVGGLDAASL